MADDNEFSTVTTLTVEVDESSLRDARQKIEDSAGSVRVSGGAGGGGGQAAARDRARSRQLLSTGIELDETRNQLLEEMLEQMEQNAFASARDGGSDGDLPRPRRSRGQTALGLGGLGVALLTLIGSGAGSVSGTGSGSTDGVPVPPPSHLPTPVPRAHPVTSPGGPTAPRPTGPNRSPGSKGTGWAAILGGAAGAAGAFGLSRFLGGGPASAASGAAAGFPALLPSIFQSTLHRQKQQKGKGWLEGLFDGKGAGGAQRTMFFRPPGWQKLMDGQGNKASSSASRRGGDVTVNVDVTAQGATKRDVERAMEKAKKQAVKEISKKVSGGGGGGTGELALRS